MADERQHSTENAGLRSKAIWIVGCVLVVALLALALWLRNQLEEVRATVAETRALYEKDATGTAANQAAVLGRLDQLQKDTQIGIAILSDDGARLMQLTSGEPMAPLHTAEEAQSKIASLGDSPDAHHLAVTMQEIDEWLMKPDDELAITDLKERQLERLRRLIRAEVTTLQKAALSAKTNRDAASEFAKAQQVLMFYPMSTDEAVVEESRLLMEQQASIGNKLQSLNRQRYNRWALDQIELALKYYNSKRNRWNPLADNIQLIDPLVQYLRPVDPAWLEPVVLDLYNYVLERMKGSLSEPNHLAFAKRLLDATTPRVAPDDI